MTAPEGVNYPLSQSNGPGAGPRGHLAEWVVVLECAPDEVAQSFVVADLEALIEQLRDWYPSGLWHRDRYAVQMRIVARDPIEALHRALACHRDAAWTARLPTSIFVRVEILTVAEFERSWHQGDPTGPTAVASSSLLCGELYSATRSLVGAVLPAELTATIAGFVTAVGGRVEPGAPRHLPAMVEVDVSLEGDQTCHATAEAFSVAGLILEQSLPALLTDARALARLQIHDV